MSFSEYAKRLALAGIVAVVASLFIRWLPQLVHMTLVVFTGVLFAVVLHGVAEWVSHRTPIPRTAAALGIFGLVLAVLLGAVWWAGPRMGDQFGRLVERIPEIVQGAVDSVRQTEWGSTLLEQLEGGGGAMPDGQEALGGVTSVVTSVTGALTSVLVILAVTVFLAFDPYLYRDPLLALFPEGRPRERTRDVLHELARTLRLWMTSRFVSMAIVGVLTGIGLSLAGVPLAFALALIAAVLAFIPFIGPILSSIPAILIGFSQGVQTALLVAGIYSAVQLVESYAIAPIVEKKLVSLPPAFVIAVQVVMGTLFGLIGVFLASPAAVVGVVIVQQLYLKDKLNQDPPRLGEA